MLNRVFLMRMLEQMVVAALVGFGAVMLAGDGAIDLSVIGAAVAAGLRGVYGVLVKNTGGDSNSPSVQ